MTLTSAEQFELSVLSHMMQNIDRNMTDEQDKRYHFLSNKKLENKKLENTVGGRPNTSQKRPTARRLRSSKARKSRKARATRRK